LKNLSKILVLVLVLSLFTNVALAEVEVDNNHVEFVERMVERTNESIEEDVLRAQKIANLVEDILGVNILSNRIVDSIVDWLQTVTLAKADATIRVGEHLGVVVECDFVYVDIGYREDVEIDPLYVIAD